MKTNIKVMMFLLTIIITLSFGIVKASNYSFSGTLTGTMETTWRNVINNRTYPTVYLSRATYNDCLFAISNNSGVKSSFYKINVGSTFQVTSIGSSSIIKLHMKNKTYHALNSVGGLVLN